MKEIRNTSIWFVEPGQVDDSHEGVDYALRRGPSLHWRGYVGIKLYHPLFGKSHTEVPLEVHGGIQYSGGPVDRLIPKPLWWFGFDCAEVDPTRFRYGSCEEYRSHHYARLECKDLIVQLLEIGRG